MVMYDVTSETSFSSCAKWLERVRSQKPDVHLPGKLHILIYLFHACHLFYFGELFRICRKKPSYFLTRKNPKYENALFIIISIVRIKTYMCLKFMVHLLKLRNFLGTSVISLPLATSSFQVQCSSKTFWKFGRYVYLFLPFVHIYDWYIN